MKKIGLISDTHGHLDARINEYFKNCDQIWHAGDFGTIHISDELKKIKPLKGVYGNIDGMEIRKEHPLHQRFYCEKVNVWMTHIGGAAGKYSPEINAGLRLNPPKIFVCGHSHILVIKFIKSFNMLHINPGAAGNFGPHLVKTILRFEIDGEKIQNMEVIELGKRGSDERDFR